MIARRVMFRSVLPALVWISQGADAATALDDQAILDQVDADMVQVVTGSRTGSGFVLNAQGDVATNHHVIRGGTSFVVKQGNRTSPAAFVWSSESTDLALLRTDLDGLEPVTLAVSPPSVLAEVIAFGYSDVSVTFDASPYVEPTRTKGNVSRSVYWGSWEDDEERLQIVQHTAQVNLGNSGGPLVDACGRVVGVNTAAPMVEIAPGVRVAGATGVYWASFIDELAEELDALAIPYDSANDRCEAAVASGSGTSAGQRADLRRQVEEQQRVTSAWLVAVLIAAGAIMVLALIASFAFESFRRTLLKTAARLRDGASGMVPSLSSRAKVSLESGPPDTSDGSIRIGRANDMDVS